MWEFSIPSDEAQANVDVKKTMNIALEREREHWQGRAGQGRARDKFIIYLFENLPDGWCCTKGLEVPYEVQTPIPPLKNPKSNPQINPLRNRQ